MTVEMTTIDDVRKLSRNDRQQQVTTWARAAFGEAEATGLAQRGVRLLEEAIEAFQACGGDEEIAHKLVAFVFARPAGTVAQELGGVSVTVLALAAAAGLSADEEECREVHRVLNKPVSEFTVRNANKNAAGFKIPAIDPYQADNGRERFVDPLPPSPVEHDCPACRSKRGEDCWVEMSPAGDPIGEITSIDGVWTHLSRVRIVKSQCTCGEDDGGEPALPHKTWCPRAQL